MYPIPPLCKANSKRNAGLTQLSEDIDENNLHAPSQSAYRPQHSTEIALIKIQNDILVSLDNVAKGVLLIPLDLSVAFGTIDHNILLTHVESRIGVTGTALCRHCLMQILPD